MIVVVAQDSKWRFSVRWKGALHLRPRIESRQVRRWRDFGPARSIKLNGMASPLVCSIAASTRQPGYQIKVRNQTGKLTIVASYGT